MESRWFSLLVVVVFSFALSGCPKLASVEIPLKTYPISGIEGVLAESGVEFDTGTSSDGSGALRIVADKPTTVRLYETGDIDAEDTQLIYRARLRTEQVQGQVYLEMWCHFDEKGEFFSRALHAPLSGTQDWTTQQTPFFLKVGENPDNVKLNVVIDGTGTVWVDDIVLAKTGP